MKYLSILMAITLLGLSFIPCSDSIIAMNDIAHEHADHSDADYTEGCSPFCTCDCCSIFVEPFELNLEIYIQPEFLVDINDKVICMYTFDYSFDFNIGIWNPPRMV